MKRFKLLAILFIGFMHSAVAASRNGGAEYEVSAWKDHLSSVKTAAYAEVDASTYVSDVYKKVLSEEFADLSLQVCDEVLDSPDGHKKGILEVDHGKTKLSLTSAKILAEDKEESRRIAAGGGGTAKAATALEGILKKECLV